MSTQQNPLANLSLTVNRLQGLLTSLGSLPLPTLAVTLTTLRARLTGLSDRELAALSLDDARALLKLETLDSDLRGHLALLLDALRTNGLLLDGQDLDGLLGLLNGLQRTELLPLLK